MQMTASDDKSIYQAPWREQLPDGSLSTHYGPQSPAALARAVKRHKNWAYKVPSLDSQTDAEIVHAFMRDEHGNVRADVPRSEMLVYREVYCKGRSVRWVARNHGLTRDSVRSYLKRLRARAALDKPTPDPAE